MSAMIELAQRFDLTVIFYLSTARLTRSDQSLSWLAKELSSAVRETAIAIAYTSQGGQRRILVILKRP